MSEQVRAELVGPGRVDVVTLGTTPVPGAPGATGPLAWAWQGVWQAATAYVVGPPAAVVRHNGIQYIALANSTGVEPGVTTGWGTSWDLFLVDGGGGGGTGGAHPDGDHTTLATTAQLDAVSATVAALDYSRVIVAKTAGVKDLAGTYATPANDGRHNKFVGNTAPLGTNANIGDEWLKTAP